jgi:hypothetical protein
MKTGALLRLCSFERYRGLHRKSQMNSIRRHLAAVLTTEFLFFHPQKFPARRVHRNPQLCLRRIIAI